MFIFPDTNQKLRSKISSYKSSFKKEKKEFGFINDGSGKRYILFGLHFVLNDLNKSEEYFNWYKDEFQDDSGEPIQKLCWALSLFRMNKHEEAKVILGDLMLSNLYFIPYLTGEKVVKLDIWHPSNLHHIDYAYDIPNEIRENITKDDIEWMDDLFQSFEFKRIRKRYIEIFESLPSIYDIESRIALLNETEDLLNMIQKK